MTQKRRRSDCPRRSVPTGRGTSPNGTRASHDAEPDDLRAMFALLEEQEPARLADVREPRPKAPAGPPPRTRTLILKRRQDGLTAAEAEARLRVRGLVHNAVLIEDFSGPQFGAVEDLTSTLEALEASAAAVQRGEIGDAEALLMAQAATLNAIFARCATAASRNLEGLYLDAADRYLRLAFRAQSQCRATIETLAVLKNPTTVFARQANIAHGPQQVNNTPLNTAAAGVSDGPDAPDVPRARAGNSGPTKLLP